MGTHRTYNPALARRGPHTGDATFAWRRFYTRPIRPILRPRRGTPGHTDGAHRTDDAVPNRAAVSMADGCKGGPTGMAQTIERMNRTVRKNDQAATAGPPTANVE